MTNKKGTQVKYERPRSVEFQMSLRPGQKQNSKPKGKKDPAHGPDLSPQPYGASNPFNLERYRERLPSFTDQSVGTPSEDMAEA